MNMVKAAATALKLGGIRIDVLVDRSAQLGLAPTQLGIAVDDLAVLGPRAFGTGSWGSRIAFARVALTPVQRAPLRIGL